MFDMQDDGHGGGGDDRHEGLFEIAMDVVGEVLELGEELNKCNSCLLIQLVAATVNFMVFKVSKDNPDLDRDTLVQAILERIAEEDALIHERSDKRGL